jgi:hypothetical protein
MIHSLYQTLLINELKCKVYVVVNDSLIATVQNAVNDFAFAGYFSMRDTLDLSLCVQVVPISVLQPRLEGSNNWSDYKNAISKFNVDAFRDGFWISTTSRFFYIWALMSVFNIPHVFHIENDVMMYESFANILDKVITDKNVMWMVQDSPERVIPSILYIPNTLSDLLRFISNKLEHSPHFINDMVLLGEYENKRCFPDKFSGNEKSKLLFDGAAIGQYLGGIDNRNVCEGDDDKLTLMNYTKATAGFVNETSTFKPNTYLFSQRKLVTDVHASPIYFNTCFTPSLPTTTALIANLHIHSKQLYQFSSVFNTQFNDIITGDRVTALCDFVIATREIVDFHKHLNLHAKDIIVIRDFANVNAPLLNDYLRRGQNNNVVKLFIYTHIFDDFIHNVLPIIDKSLQLIIYLHNSDHGFEEHHMDVLQHPNIMTVYAQNLNVPQHPKLNILPIGIANSMWQHGNLITLYGVMKDRYMFKKYKNLYVNINGNTHSVRRELLQACEGQWNISSNKDYVSYLNELSQHRFGLCVRGNGVDTHRFWECLYLGVIPVVIDNKSTDCKNFLDHVENLNVPFVRLRKEDNSTIPSAYPDSYFGDALYVKCAFAHGRLPHANEALKMSYYKS